MKQNISDLLKKFLLNCMFKIKIIKKNNYEFEILKSFFYKQVLNLTELNNINYFKECNNYYLNIIKTFEYLNYLFTLNYNSKNGYKIIKLKKDILLYLNLLSPKRIKDNLILINSDY